MATNFKNVFDNIAEGLKDLTTLEVVTYRGTIKIEAAGVPTSFASTLDNAKAQGDFKVVASTLAELSGDIKAFYDKDASEADIAAHNRLVDSAVAKREAVIRMFEGAIADAIKGR